MLAERRPRHLLLIIIIIFFIACASSGKESYRQGEELSETGNWEGAIAFYKDALAQEPKNKRYQKSLRKAEQEAAKKYYENAVSIWAGAAVKDHRVVTSAMASLDKAMELDPENADIRELHHQIDSKEQELAAAAKRAYKNGIAALDKQKWLEAVTNFRKVTATYPKYEDTEDKLTTAVSAGSEAYYKEGVSAVQREDWKGALTAFGKVMNLNPTYKDTQALLDQVRENDNPLYFLRRAEEMASANEWDRAIHFYETALSYLPDDPNIQTQLDKAKLQAGRYYFKQGIQHSKKNRLYRANQEYQKAMLYSPTLASSSFFKASLSSHSKKVFQRAAKYEEVRKYGNALVWYWQLNKIYPGYPELFYKMQTTEDIIKKRLKKAIAVLDFSSPSHNPDAGTTASSNLITYLFNNSSGDIRILERQHLQSILTKINLKQAGLVGNMETARRVGRMTGIDIFIAGNVLLYKTEMDVSKGNKVAKIQVGTKVQDNPDYLIWKARNPKPTKDQLNAAPPAVVEIPQYRYESYTVGRNKMRAAFHVYYKVIDAKKGETIATDTIKRNAEVADDWNDGIPGAKIPFNPMELPTESELLEQVTTEVVRNLALTILKLFQGLQATYFKEAEILMKRSQNEKAIEKYMDAIFDERIKGIETPISRKSNEVIEQLISKL